MDWRDEEQVVLRRIVALLWSLAHLAERVPRGDRHWLLSLMQQAQAMTAQFVIDRLPPCAEPDAFAHPVHPHDAPLDTAQLGHGFRVLAWALAYLLASAPRPAHRRFPFNADTPRAAIASGHPLAAINRRSRGPPPAALRD
jgi:hypothetical protein